MLILLNSCTYYLCDLVDIRATELHNGSKEEAKEDEKADMDTCEASESGSNLFGKTCYVIIIDMIHIRHMPYRIVGNFRQCLIILFLL